MALIDFFDRGWRRNRDGLAYVMGQEAWTFEEARIYTCRVAVGVRRLAHGMEGTAAVLAPNSPAAWMCVLGIWRAGLAWLPLNPGYPPKVLADHLRRFDGRLVFFDSRLLNEVMELQADLSRHGSKVKFVCLDEPIESFESVTDWSDTSCAEAETNSIVAIMPTGGTTGRPKGVVVTQQNATAFVSHVLAEFTYKADEKIVNLAAAPLTHTAGMLSIPASARGGTVAMLERADPRAILKAIETYGVTETFLPPTVIYRLLEQGDVSQYDLASLKYLLYGAAPMSTAKLKQALTVFGPVMMEGYGQTEAFASIAVLRPEEHFLNGSPAPDTRLKSCGRPSTYIDLRIINEAGETAEPGETGEICVRGDVVTPGYYKGPRADRRDNHRRLAAHG
ncbi:class I adenylate-forming enzyme family protein [Thermocatellispora tengchongensis]|uniref:class I adenylate-forming enzyme family protein n=1 Tax=Thermocatellispora tengchongensis TaxID=1073253 RepID=UPI00364374FC